MVLLGELFLYFLMNPVECPIVGLELERFPIFGHAGNHYSVSLQIGADFQVVGDFEDKMIRTRHMTTPSLF